MIPEPTYPEYRLTLVWRADTKLESVRTYLEHVLPDTSPTILQASFHMTDSLAEALISAISHFAAS